MANESTEAAQDSRCPTHLLSDQPTTEDALGGHTRVAEALANLVREEPGGRSVALTGAWGSGKSSVIRVMSALLGGREAPDVHVFSFDAWAHQGDPLRRSFLEALIADLVAKEWLPAAEWKAELDRLARRREEVESSSEPVLTGGGWLVAASFLLVPLGFALFSKYATASLHGGVAWLALVGLLLIVSPLLTVGGLRLFCGRRGTASGEAQSSFGGLLLNKTVERTKTTTHRSVEPTSLEFTAIFERAVKQVLGPVERRLVLVMDNLDRVVTSDALSIWSTMRSFTDVIGGSQLQRLWVIVPIDVDALHHLWPDENDGPNLAEAFRQKTFQVEYRVPAPALSRWRAYLRSQLVAALPMHTGASLRIRQPIERS